jgi:hypothetical protein
MVRKLDIPNGENSLAGNKSAEEMEKDKKNEREEENKEKKKEEKEEKEIKQEEKNNPQPITDDNIEPSTLDLQLPVVDERKCFRCGQRKILNGVCQNCGERYDN